MNRIEFRLIGRDGYPGKSIQILIDGDDLIRMLGDFERRFTEDESLLADYSLPDAKSLTTDANLYLQLRAGEKPHWIKGKTALFTCSCGNSGCWDMVVNIFQQNDKIIWADFEQINRGPDCAEFWDYSAFGPFKFDAAQYLTALEHVRQQAINL